MARSRNGRSRETRRRLKSVVGVEGHPGVGRRAADSLEQQSRFLWSRVFTDFAWGGERAFRLGICSSLPGEGATTVATNFAAYLAHNGKRVTLLETNLRNPCLGAHFGIESAPGLGEYLEGTARLDELPRTGAPGLRLVTAGSGPSEATLELAVDHLGRLFEFLSGQGEDVLIVDCPPLAVSPEARVVMRSVDSAVLVVGANRVRKSRVTRSLRELQELGVPVAGTVLNWLKYEVPPFLAKLI